MADHFNLNRFIEAQADTYEAALSELTCGHKTSHWMWFIFPQLTGLGNSPMARFYAIMSLAEAEAYLHHPLLGARLRGCVEVLQQLPPTTPEAVFGSVDARKLRSSLTLFLRAGGGPLFDEALQRWYSGRADEATDRLLGESS